jgi:hypothetical protein
MTVDIVSNPELNVHQAANRAFGETSTTSGAAFPHFRSGFSSNAFRGESGENVFARMHATYYFSDKMQ